MDRAEEVEQVKNSEHMKKVFSEKRNTANHIFLNFFLPHEFGGLGDPIE